MKMTFRRTISFILSICIIFSLCVGVEMSAMAADVSVNIVSFTRGEQEDLRSSELLEARVTGYDGNVNELTYEWTNGLGTYLYVFNTHNMYSINGTDGEIEIYNDSVESSANMTGRSYENTFSGKGYAWAAIYGANLGNSALVGTVTVNVKDADGNIIATDSHTGTRKRVGWGRYTYSSFVTSDLGEDVENVAFGMFEGDTRKIKNLLGESAIVHVTCDECTISDGEITSGSEYISLSSTDGEYYITGLSAGSATISMSVEKGNCKFHQNDSAESITTVYVYKKPTATPTTTTITLGNLDENCTYYIDGVQGVEKDGAVVFEGLTPNTAYTIEAQGHVEGTDVVYAYTTATTLPVYVATVMVYLNGTYDTTTGVASGTLKNIDELEGTGSKIYVKDINSTEYIEFTHTSTGVYTYGLPNGTYHIYSAPNEESLLGHQHLDINGDDRTRYEFYNSVEYDLNGGSGGPAVLTEYYRAESAVNVSSDAPVRAGYIFRGWTDESGNTYQPGVALTSAIGSAYKLTAQWEQAVNVKVNVTINHSGGGGSDDNHADTMDDVTFSLLKTENHINQPTGLSKSLSSESYSGYTYSYDAASNVTTYTAAEATFTDLASGDYTVFVEKTGYDTTVTKGAADADGTQNIDIVLTYAPTNHDLAFEVVMADDALKSLYPKAVNVKVTHWGHDENDELDWWIINQQEGDLPPVTVEIDSETGKGTGYYPVWTYWSGTTNAYEYRIIITSYVMPDGSIVKADNYPGDIYVSTDGVYSGAVTVENGGRVPSYPAGSSTSASGAYFENDTQNGVPTATISVNAYDVTFDAQGGTVNGQSTQTVADQIKVPAFADYVPVRDGGYTFAGWYEDEAFTTAAAEGKALIDNITLYAKWNDPLTVSGTVTIAGTYELEGNTHTIHDVDRAAAVMVLLQKIDANGYPETIESKEITVTYTDGTPDIGTGTYEFTGIINDGHAYRIKTIACNYVEEYQNELSASTVVTNYESYDETHYTAEFNGDSLAMVNAYLHFIPTSFDLKYEINATAIGEGYRPTAARTLILYDDGLNGVHPQNWAVISQMVHGDAYTGQSTAVTDGTGNNSYSVWNNKPDGQNLYDYALKLQTYTMNGAEATLDGTEPFMVYYNGSARFSPVNGQTQTLTITMVPKMYTINFDLNAGEDEITGMDTYLNPDGTCTEEYYWSIGEEITAKPVRRGYIFRGWTDAEGNTVTAVSADMAEDIYLTAQWEELSVTYTSDYAYIFGYTDTTMGAEGELLRCEVSAMIHRLVKQNNKLDGFVYNEADEPDFTDIAGEWFRSGIEFMNYKGALPSGDNIYPYSKVTRGEAFKLICIGLGFVEDTTLTEEDYAQFLYSAGFIVGDENGDLNTGDYINRAEFCTLYNRIIGRENAVLTDSNGNEINAATYGFTDLDASAWYYQDMLRATSAYDSNGYVDLQLRGIRNNLDDYNG